MAIDFVRNIITSGYNIAKINDNFAKIETALVDGVSRSGEGPNQMGADLDLNSNDLLNVGQVDAQTLILNGELVQPVTLAGALKTVNALSELPAAGLSDEARTNLGLGDSATRNVGTTSSDVARGDIVSRYENTVSCADFGAVSDCTGQGIGTDVIPSILAAVNYAVSTFGDGCRVVLPAGRYRASTPAILDLAGKHQIYLDFIGTITPDSVSMTMLTIRNAFDLKFTANLFEGGIFLGWAAPLPFGVNYFTTQEAVASGGQEAFKFQGVFGYRVEIKAFAYAGRVVRTTEKANPAHIQTGAISGYIETGRSYNFSEPRVAQSIWADPGTQIGTGNWGALERLACDFDYYGPVWVNLNDIEISTIDSAFGFDGPEFRGCVVVQGNFWYVGGIDGTATGKHISFIPSADRECQSIEVSRMRFLDAGTGLYISGGHSYKTSVEYSAQPLLPVISACEVLNARNVDIRVAGNGSGERLFRLSGATSDNVKVHVDEWDFIATDDVIFIASDVGGNVSIIEPALTHAPVGKARIAVAGTGVVLVIDPVIRGSTGFVFDIASTSNQVLVTGGHYGGSSTLNKTASPRQLSNIIGLTDYSFGDRRINNGGNSAGAGGAISFGIIAGGLETYSPIAQVKAKLTNATPSELQGGISLQYRPTGAAGQALADGLEVSHTTTDNETVGVLLTRISGSMVAKRVKVGAINTGPGAAGRAVFVDN